MTRKAFTVITMVVMAVAIALAWLAPSSPGNSVQLAPAPSPTSTMGIPENLPLCASEGGLGQALCWWDARTMGNGMGTSVVSGDCAPDHVGSVVASQVCMELYAQPSYIAYINAQGDTAYVLHGSDLVRECNNDIEALRIAEGNSAQLVFDDGFSALECYKSYMN